MTYSHCNESIHLLHLSKKCRDKRWLTSSDLSNNSYQLTRFNSQVDTVVEQIMTHIKHALYFTIVHYSTYSFRQGLSGPSHVKVPLTMDTDSSSPTKDNNNLLCQVKQYNYNTCKRRIHVFLTHHLLARPSCWCSPDLAHRFEGMLLNGWLIHLPEIRKETHRHSALIIMYISLYGTTRYI